MGIDNERIIQKMMDALNQAKNSQQDTVNMKRHIAKVQVLCELILEDPVTKNIEKTKHQEITNQEMIAMIGKSQTQTNQPTRQQFKKSVTEDSGSSDSLFDF